MKAFVYALALLISFNLLAWSFSPLIGFEEVQKTEPYAHTNSRFIYGARLMFGPPILSLEMEGSGGQDTEEFSNPYLKIKEKVFNDMLGVRSTVNLVWLEPYLRAGLHLRDSSIERTQNGVTTEEDPSSYLSPYLGAGTTIGPGPVRLQAGVTAIFINHPQSGDTEYQYSLGILLGF